MNLQSRLYLILLVIAVAAVGCRDSRAGYQSETDARETASSEPDAARTAAKDGEKQAGPVVVASPPSRTFADAVQRSRPAVVNIFTRTRVKTNRYVYSPMKGVIPEERLAQSLGSGFIIDAEGHVLTNYHVVRGATAIEVRLFDERRFPAELVGYDPKTDIALLKVEKPESLPVAKLGDSDTLRVGDWVIAIGNPLGLTSTVTAGIVSATGRTSLPIGDLAYQDFIQTDASINPGNSGGALLDADGDVIGINTAVNQGAQGIGFAIPLNMVREILPRLKKGGKLQRSWLGLYIDPVPAQLREELEIDEEGGALVTRIVPGGPAAVAGLKPGDIILELGGEVVEDADQLAWIAGNIGVGKEVNVTLQRGTDRLGLTVKMGALPD